MWRRLWIGLGLVAALAALGYASAVAFGIRTGDSVVALLAATRPPIVVGLLHSLNGPLAITEKAMLDGEVLALEEINARGGISGRLVRWEIADGRSDPSTFATEARRLIEEKQVNVLFGCYNAECRKAVRSVVDERDSLLLMPGNYEGMEPPSRVVYMGGSANQTVVPAVRWCVDSLKARRFFVVGQEELWSRAVSEIAKDSARAMGGEVVGEIYQPLSAGDIPATIAAIRAAKPDVILNTMAGDANLPFYTAIREAGITPDKTPVVAFGIAEDELSQFPKVDVIGQYAACSYFQGLDRPENRDFVRRFKTRYGSARPTSDPIVAAYNGVNLWAQAVGEVGSARPREVLGHIVRQSLDAPEGIITVLTDSLILWRPFHVGRVRADGQFDIIHSLKKPIHPLSFVGTRSRARWEAFLDDLKSRWGGRWSSAGMPRFGSPPPQAR